MLNDVSSDELICLHLDEGVIFYIKVFEVVIVHSKHVHEWAFIITDAKVS
jgi:hypothetical protein